MLKNIKSAVLRCAEASGASARLGGSVWRNKRLLILCYHGVSKSDEHEWDYLYVSAETFRRRMAAVAHAGCHVLPLSEALVRLREETLPARAVAITFDDGLHDFYSVAFPILEEFGYPVTLYLSTYYVEFNRPVFDPMCSYLLWRARHQQLLEWPEIFPDPVALDRAGRQHVLKTIKKFSIAKRLSGQEKDNLLSQFASRLHVDYEDLCRKRVLHLVNGEEATELASRGVSLEYHTHRHREYRSRERMFSELRDNHRYIARYTSIEPRHFCYTGGFYLPEYPAYLKEYGISSATTCLPGFCTPATNPFLLRRLVDTMALSDLEFRAWLAGTAGLLPARRTEVSEGQLEELAETEQEALTAT